MRRYISILPLLLITAILTAACGGSSSGGDPTTSASKSNNKMVAFSECMRSHGVPSFPDLPSNGSGGLQIQSSQKAGSGSSMTVNGVSINAPAFRSAMQTCRKYLPHGGTLSAAQTAQLKAKALAMARCMRSHGVPDFPDPTFTQGPGGGGFAIRLGGPGLDRNSPAFQAAQKVCQPILGAPKGAGATSG